jgi:hypothetical protein
LKRFLYKSLNWFVGLILFNAFWMLTVLVFDVTLPKIGGPEMGLKDIQWRWYIVPAWVLFTLVYDFDAIGFLKNVRKAFDDAAGMNEEKKAA